MPTSSPSIQEILERRRRETFVGRDEQLDCFREQLALAADDPRRRFVLSVFGQGGVGKSTLLRQYLRLAANAGAAAALSNDLEGDAPAAMARLAEQLGAAGGGGPFHAFNERYTTFRRRRDELESQPDAPQGLAGLFARTATRVGAKVLRNTVPGSDLALDFLEEPLADQASQWAEFVRRKLGNRDETQLVLEPAAVLSPLFVQGLAALAGGRRVALLFDTYERTAPFLDGWLRALLEGRHGAVPADVTFVMAGRAELDRNAWAEMEELIVRLSLDPFSDEVARDYLARRGISHPQVIDVILKLSGRLPLLLATLAAESPTDPARVGDATGTAVERFLSWVDDPARRALALNAALPRRLDRDVVGVLGGDAAGFEWLVANPFVESRADGWGYHDVVREQILRYQRKASPAMWTSQHEALAAYYRAMRDELATDAKEGADNSRWREAAREELYHRLCARPDGALAGALNGVVAALDGQWDLARDWAEVMAEAGKDSGHQGVQEWGDRIGKGLSLKRFDANAQVTLFSQLIAYDGLETAQRAIVLTFRGSRYGFNGRTDDALDDFEHAIALNPQAFKPVLERAEVYAMLERTVEALADFGKAIEKNPQATQPILARARFYAKLKNTAEALADFDHAVVLASRDAWPLVERAWFCKELRRHDEALSDLNRAITLYPQDLLPLEERALLYSDLRRYDEALADLNQAVALRPQDAWPLGERSLFYRQLRRYNEALADINQAVALASQDTWVFLERARLYRELRRYDEALADIDQAIGLDPQDSWPLLERVQFFREVQRYNDALADIIQVFALEPDDDWLLYLRATTYRALAIPDWHADLDHAIALAQAVYERRPSEKTILFNIALYYLAAGNDAAAAILYDEALLGTPLRLRRDVLREAIADLDDYLRLFPDDEAAARLRALLQAETGTTTVET